MSSRIISIVLSTLLLICFKGTFAKDNQSYIKVITNSPLTNLTPNKFCESEICLELISLIDNAEDSIDFAIYGLRGQDEVLSALINAKKRGVKIKGNEDIFLM